MNYDSHTPATQVRIKKFINVIARSVATRQSSLGHNQAWKILNRVQDDKQTTTTYPSSFLTNQKGAIPVILIIAGVVIVIAVLATILSFSFNQKPNPSPTPTANCIDKDYTGCDEEPENFTWQDDGKR